MVAQIPYRHLCQDVSVSPVIQLRRPIAFAFDRQAKRRSETCLRARWTPKSTTGSTCVMRGRYTVRQEHAHGMRM